MGKQVQLPRDQRRALASLSTLASAEGLYLAGGVAIALHLGHRRSLDLDLFSRAPGVDLARVRDALARTVQTVEVVALTDASLRVLVAGTPVDIVAYPYRLLQRPMAGPEGIAVARLRDLATMKLAAVAQRGLYRDFWDLHEILTHGVTLGRALGDYTRRYGAARSDHYHVLRALTYFGDAESATVLPAGLTRRHWTLIRDWFEEQAARALLRLGR